MVDVPTVSQAFVTPLPALISWLIDELLFKLWPGSSTITLPASEPDPATTVGLTVGVGFAVADDVGRAVAVAL